MSENTESFEQRLERLLSKKKEMENQTEITSTVEREMTSSSINDLFKNFFQTLTEQVDKKNQLDPLFKLIIRTSPTISVESDNDKVEFSYRGAVKDRDFVIEYFSLEPGTTVRLQELRKTEEYRVVLEGGQLLFKIKGSDLKFDSSQVLDRVFNYFLDRLEVYIKALK